MEQIIHNNGKVKLTKWGKNFHIFTPCALDYDGKSANEPMRTATILSCGYVRFYLSDTIRKVSETENFDARSYAEKMYTEACKRLGVPA